MKRLLIILFVLILLLPPVQALQMLSGDNLSVDVPIDDDVFAAGDTIAINAPVTSVVLAGGNISINAPVSGDVFLAGGEIDINSDVGGKIVAAGGNIQVNGNATNAVIAGGQVNILPTAVISRDAVISASSVSNAGTIVRNLTVRAEQFQNTGSTGRLDYQKSEGLQEFQQAMARALSIVHILVTLGFLILGIILLKVFPTQFLRVEAELRKSPLRDTAVGFGLIIIAVIVIFVLAFTIVGVPAAFILGMLFIIALLLSSLFVSFALGRTIVDLLKVKTNDVLIFILGFIIISLLFRIPYAGWLIRIVALSLGFGAIVYAVRENWQSTTTSGA
jgi:hypothetical protein